MQQFWAILCITSTVIAGLAMLILFVMRRLKGFSFFVSSRDQALSSILLLARMLCLMANAKA